MAQSSEQKEEFTIRTSSARFIIPSLSPSKHLRILSTYELTRAKFNCWLLQREGAANVVVTGIGGVGRGTEAGGTETGASVDVDVQIGFPLVQLQYFGHT